jgi:hypothetical protein
VAFNTNGEDDGNALVNDAEKYKGPPCGRCGRTNHSDAKCHYLSHMFLPLWLLNWCTLKGGVSLTQSPAEIVLNRKLDFNAHCKIEFDEYVQTHEEHDNSLQARTVGAIATCPTGNNQGGYYFIRLDTGRRIN